jgi:sulfatase modifying factor 1
MDATEVTNNEYRQFVYWVRDSIVAHALNKAGYKTKYVVQDKKDDSRLHVDWAKIKTLKWNEEVMEALSNDPIMLSLPDRIFGKKEIDPNKIIYHSEVFDLKKAAMAQKNRDGSLAPRSQFVVKYDLPIYPDTLVWIRTTNYSYYDPMTKRYFSHPAYGNYPVVGVTWKQATAYCEWRTHYLNSYLNNKKRPQESDFRGTVGICCSWRSFTDHVSLG